MRLEPLYRATFTTPGAWSAELAGPAGTEGQSFLIAEGRCEGRLPGRLRRANYRGGGPATPSGQTFAASFRQPAARRCSSHGTDTRGPPRAESASSLAALPVSGDERYRWLNDVVCTLTGEVRPRSDGTGPGVGYDVAELVWEPLA
jgi:hypothetical protein